MKSDSRLFALSVLVLVATAVQTFDDETVSDELLEIFQGSPVDDDAGAISGAGGSEGQARAQHQTRPQRQGHGDRTDLQTDSSDLLAGFLPL